MELKRMEGRREGDRDMEVRGERRMLEKEEDERKQGRREKIKVRKEEEELEKR